MVTVDFDLDEFTELAVSMAAIVTITQGNDQKVTVTGQRNILDRLSRRVRGETWYIGPDDDRRRMRDYKRIEVKITMAQLNALAISGSGTVQTTNHFKTNRTFELAISGSGDAELSLDAVGFEVSISGSGNAILQGSGNNIEVNIAGSGNLKAADLKVKTCEVNTAGSGKTEIAVSESLEASLVGSGNVYYQGSPKVRVSSVGSGRVIAMSE